MTKVQQMGVTISRLRFIQIFIVLGEYFDVPQPWPLVMLHHMQLAQFQNDAIMQQCQNLFCRVPGPTVHRSVESVQCHIVGQDRQKCKENSSSLVDKQQNRSEHVENIKFSCCCLSTREPDIRKVGKHYIVILVKS